MEELRGLNYSLRYESSIGILQGHDSLEYSGCIGSLQRNETDILLTPLWYDVPVRGPGLKQGVVDGFERVGILSAYNRTRLDSGTRTHVLDMVYGFSPGLWLLTLVTLAVLSLLLQTSLRTRRIRKYRSKKTMFALIASLLKQHSSSVPLIPSIGCIRTFYFLMTLFGFLIGFYLTSLIKTEMVVVQPPVTVESYDEIIESGRRPSWVSLLTDVNQFKEAKGGTKEAKIWDMAVRMGVNNSMVESSLMSVLMHVSDIARLKEVALLKHQIVYGNMLRTACAFSRSKDYISNANPLFMFDESSKERLLGHVYNKHLDKRTTDHMNARRQLMFESGLRDTSFRFVDFTGILGNDLYDKHTSIEECFSNVIRIPHPEYMPVDMRHYASLFWLMIGFIYFSLMVMLFELYNRH